MAACSLAKKICRNSHWGLLASFAALSCFLFSNPDWGAFQSHHVGAGFWLAGMVWMAVLTFDRTETECRAWFSLWLLAIAAEGNFFPRIHGLRRAALCPALFGLWPPPAPGCSRLLCCSPSVRSGATALVLLLNYAVSGMPLENPWRFMWGLANQAKFSRWCSPYLPTYFNEGSSQNLGRVSLLAFLQNQRTPADWMTLLRGSELAGLLPAWPALLVLPFVIIAGTIGRKDGTRTSSRRALPLLLALIVAVGIADIPGSPQSVYRNYAFMPFYLAPLLVIGWKQAIDWIPLGWTRPLFSSAHLFSYPAAARVISAWNRMYAQRAAAGHSRWPDFAAFATGRISLQEALARGDGLWPVAQAARAAIGISRNIFCFNRWISYEGSFAFPGTGLLTEPSRAPRSAGSGTLSLSVTPPRLGRCWKGRRSTIF